MDPDVSRSSSGRPAAGSIPPADPRVRPFAELARGPFTAVYKAFDASSGSVVFLKRLHGTAPEQRARFAEEARLAATVDHPNVVRVLHASEEALVAEWVEGPDLSTVLSDGPLPAELATFVARETARGLAAIHEAGVVHRDVAPGNVLLASDGGVKLTDFGLASHEGSPPDDEVRGTVETLAPEVVRGEPADVRSDVFSLGAVLAHMLTGRPPFARADRSATLDAVLHVDPTAGFENDPRVPTALAEIVTALLSKDPAARPSSATETAERLTAALDSLGAVGASDLAAYLDDPSAYRSPPRLPFIPDETVTRGMPAPDRPPAASPTRRGWAIAGLAGLVAAVGLVALSLRPDPPPTVPVAEEPAATLPVGIAQRDSPDEAPRSPAPTSPPDRVLDDSPPPPRESPESVAQAERTVPAPPPSPAAPDAAVEERPAPPPPPAPEEAEPLPGTLSVRSQPWANVRVAGRDLGVTPIEAVTLPAGRHTITLTNQDFPPHTTEIDIPPGGQARAVVSLWESVGRVSLDVRPWAVVFVDGERWGRVPPQTRPLVLLPGSHLLRFEHPELGSQEVSVRITAGERRTVPVRMGTD